MDIEARTDVQDGENGHMSDVARLSVGVDGTTLPTQEIVTGRTFTAGKSSSGKSNTATVVAEEVLDRGIPVGIVDPEGEYRALADEYPVVVAGHGETVDVEATPSNLHTLGRRAVAESLPVVLDTSEATDLEEEQELAGAFVGAVYRAGQRHQMPYLLVVDEFHDFAPNREKTPSSKPLARVSKRGRKRGIGLFALSQRPADVSTETLAQADTQIWHRLTWDNDVDRARTQLGAGRANQLADLEDGEAFVLADYFEDVARVQFRRQRVEDLGSTPDVARALDTVPSEVPSDFGFEPESTEDSEGDTPQRRDHRLGTYTVHGGSLYAQLGKPVTEHLEAEEGDTFVLYYDGDGLLGEIGESGDWEYSIFSRGTYQLAHVGHRALRELGVESGDQLQVRTHGEQVRITEVSR